MYFSNLCVCVPDYTALCQEDGYEVIAIQKPNTTNVKKKTADLQFADGFIKYRIFFEF
jgi:hypothetical protein